MGTLKIIENTDTSIGTFQLPEIYSGVLVRFYAANVYSTVVYIDKHALAGNVAIHNQNTNDAIEHASIRLDPETHIITVTIPNKNQYQKMHGNFFDFWGVK